jgi:dipeptidyl aminopeptidase/acylaminoacyl peptidase
MKIAIAVLSLTVLTIGMPGSAQPGCCPNPGGEDYAPAWSPTGTLIAFTRFGQIDIGTFVVHPDGSGLKQVSGSTTFSWAPEGQRIVVGGGHLEIVDTDGRSLLQLTQGSYDAYPAWSPNGREIAFRRAGGAVWVIAAEGGPPKLLARDSPPRGRDVASRRITWSPDGSRLAFVARRGPGNRGDDQIHVVASDGTGERVLAGSKADEEEPIWSPNGTQIAFSSGLGRQRDVYVVHADGTKKVNVTSSRGWDGEPAWSPDGATLSFEREAGLYLVPASGGAARLLTRYGSPSHSAWSSDGSRLSFMGRGACLKWGIVVIPSSGGEPDLITNDCYISGTNGNDTIRGTLNRDIVHGGPGNDTIALDAGNDEAWGDEGDDVILGGKGNDIIVGGSGRDSLFGGRGNDRLFTADGEVDNVSCGARVDWVVADRLDHVASSCERVRRR